MPSDLERFLARHDEARGARGGRWTLDVKGVLGFLYLRYLGPKPTALPYPYPDFAQVVFLADAVGHRLCYPTTTRWRRRSGVTRRRGSWALSSREDCFWRGRSGSATEDEVRRIVRSGAVSFDDLLQGGAGHNVLQTTDHDR